jgi:hypothetical protein
MLHWNDDIRSWELAVAVIIQRHAETTIALLLVVGLPKLVQFVGTNNIEQLDCTDDCLQMIPFVYRCPPICHSSAGDEAVLTGEATSSEQLALDPRIQQALVLGREYKVPEELEGVFSRQHAFQ